VRTALGLITPLVAYSIITALHLAIPTRRTAGYATHPATGTPLTYRINGRFVLLAAVLAWFALGSTNVVPYEWLYETRWLGLVGAVVIGVTFSLVIVLRYPPTGRHPLADLWFGRAREAQLKDGLIDAKMWFYLIGAVMLQLNVLSFAAHHLATVDHVNPGFLLACAMLTWFVVDYLTFEKIHLWTYDFIAERVGFKLGFGCLAFYPYFYAVPLWFVADRFDPGWPAWLTAVCGVLFLCGWALTRGANLQKYLFKTAPERAFLGMKPEVLTDGKNTLLVNGFWGASRHINYLGEIVQAVAIALAVGYWGLWVVWLYPAYYVALLFTRQADDDKVCRAKYGTLWDRYTAEVKYRIVPGVY
jgi:delta14-sterol reductase